MRARVNGQLVDCGEPAGVGQEEEAHHRSRGRPPRGARGPRQPPRRLARDGAQGRRGRGPGRADAGRGVRALVAPFLPEVRLRARRTVAAAVLVQLAAGRLHDLHRARRGAGSGPRQADRRPRPLARSRSVGRRTGGAALVPLAAAAGDQPGDGLFAHQAVAHAPRGGAEGNPVRHRERAQLRLRRRALALGVPRPVRGARPQPRAPPPRNLLERHAGRDRALHVDAPVPGVRRQASAPRGPGGARRRSQHLRGGQARRQGRPRLVRRPRAHRPRADDRRQDPEGDRRPARVHGRSRPRLPDARPQRRARSRAARRSGSASRPRSARS